MAALLVSPFKTIPLCVCAASLPFSSPYKDTNHIGLRTYPKGFIFLNHLFKDLLSTHGYILRYWGWDFNICIYQDIFQPITQGLGSFVGNHLWEFNSRFCVLFSWSVCLSLCHHHTLLIIITLYVVSYEIRKWNNFQLYSSFSKLFWLFRVSWDLIYILGWIFFYFYKKKVIVTLYLPIILWSIGSLPRLTLSIHEHRVSFHLLVSSFIPFSNICSFQCISLSSLWLSLFLSILFFLILL